MCSLTQRLINEQLQVSKRDLITGRDCVRHARHYIQRARAIWRAPEYMSKTLMSEASNYASYIGYTYMQCNYNIYIAEYKSNCYKATTT